MFLKKKLLPYIYNHEQPCTLLSCRCTDVLYIKMILSKISINVLSSVVFSEGGMDMGCVAEDEGVAVSKNDRLLIRDTGEARAVFKSSNIGRILYWATFPSAHVN